MELTFDVQLIETFCLFFFWVIFGYVCVALSWKVARSVFSIIMPF